MASYNGTVILMGKCMYLMPIDVYVCVEGKG